MVDYSSRHSILKNDVVYRHKTGRLLAHRIGQSFKELGYHAWINVGQTNGVDLKVWDNELNLVVAAEILNWAPTTNLDKNRKARIVRNLLSQNCNRLLIYTEMGNEFTLKDLSPQGISTLKIGYQILARYFYSKLDANQAVGRKIDSRETKLLIKSKLKDYLLFLNAQSLAANAPNIA